MQSSIVLSTLSKFNTYSKLLKVRNSISIGRTMFNYGVFILLGLARHCTQIMFQGSFPSSRRSTYPVGQDMTGWSVGYDSEQQIHISSVMLSTEICRDVKCNRSESEKAEQMHRKPYLKIARQVRRSFLLQLLTRISTKFLTLLGLYLSIN